MTMMGGRMWKIIIIIAALAIGALVIKNVGCGCGSKKEVDSSDSKKKSSCCS